MRSWMTSDFGRSPYPTRSRFQTCTRLPGRQSPDGLGFCMRVPEKEHDPALVASVGAGASSLNASACQTARKRNPGSASNRGSDSLLVELVRIWSRSVEGIEAVHQRFCSSDLVPRGFVVDDAVMDGVGAGIRERHVVVPHTAATVRRRGWRQAWRYGSCD